MLDALTYILSFVLALGILITVHEFGHFWVARKLGVKVIRFSIGFGKPIWRRQKSRDATEYVLASIPLGGYVKMLDEREMEVPEQDKQYAFNNKSVRSRFAIVAAGPVFNFLFAIFALWIMYMNGIPGVRAVVGDVEPGTPAAYAGFVKGDQIQRTGDTDTPTWDMVRMVLFEAALDRKVVDVEVQTESGNKQIRKLSLNLEKDPIDSTDLISDIGIKRWAPPAVLGKVLADGPADQAGLKPGDRILKVNDTPIDGWIEWVRYVRQHPGETAKIVFDRAGISQSKDMRIGTTEVEGKPIGQAKVTLKEEYWKKLELRMEYNPWQAMKAGVVKTWDMSVLMLRVLARIATGQASLRNISGPITIAQYAGDSASLGIIPFLSFLAIVSVSLGVLNLLPIPVLDGGHLLYYLIEMVKGSPVSEQVQATGQQVGILLLVALMALAFYNDLIRLFG